MKRLWHLYVGESVVWLAWRLANRCGVTSVAYAQGIRDGIASVSDGTIADNPIRDAHIEFTYRNAKRGGV